MKSLVNSMNKKQNKKLGLRNNVSGWVLMLPMVIILYLFVWRPTVLGGFMSFFKMQGYTMGEFCGLDNYRIVISNTQFLPLLGNTVKYVILSLVIGFIPPIAIALMMNEVIHGKGTFRTLIYIPVIIPGISAMLMWYFLYYPDETGLLNMILGKLGIEPYLWLNDPDFAILGIIIYSTWKNFGGAMLLFFAALQGTSKELYEATIIDGAGMWQRFRNVTLPSIEGVIILNFVRQIIAVFQIMEEPLAMTGGGPKGASATLAYQLYQYGFNSGGKGTGQAMALGVIMFLILIVFTIGYFWLNKKIENRY